MNIFSIVCVAMVDGDGFEGRANWAIRLRAHPTFDRYTRPIAAFARMHAG